MKKINLTRKLLFFLGLAPLNEEIDLDFNFKTRTIIILIFISSIFLFNKYFLNIFIYLGQHFIFNNYKTI